MGNLARIIPVIVLASLGGCSTSDSASNPDLAPTAEEVFRKIEEVIVNAKGLRVTIRPSRDGGQYPKKGIGVLLLSGNRAWYSDDIHATRETWCICDGKRVQKTRSQIYDEGIAEGFRPYDRGPASELLEKNLKMVVSRSGFRMDLASMAFEPLQTLDYSKELKVSDIRFGEKSDGVNSLTYSLRLGEEGSPSVVSLWYDPATLTPLRRMARLKDGRTISLMESYEEFILNPVIPDEKFKLR